VIEQPLHHDVAAAHQPHGLGRLFPDQPFDIEHRGAGGIDQRGGAEGACGSLDPPAVPLAPRGGDGGAGQHRGAVFRRVAGVEDHQPRIVHPAVRIFKAGAETGGERRACRVAAEVHRARRGQQAAPADVIVEEQPQPQQPARAQALHVRQDEAQRVDDVRGDGPQRLPLGQRFAHQRELVVLQIAQAAVDQLGRGGRGSLRQIAAFQQQHPRAAPRGVARDARAVDAPTDHRQIELIHDSPASGPYRRPGSGFCLAWPGGIKRRNSVPRSL